MTKGSVAKGIYSSRIPIQISINRINIITRITILRFNKKAMLPLCSSLFFRIASITPNICYSHDLEKGIPRLNEGKTILIYKFREIISSRHFQSIINIIITLYRLLMKCHHGERGIVIVYI